MTNLFGRLISGAEVERRIAAFIRDVDEDAGGSWLETYFGEVARVEGYVERGEHLERPLDVVPASDLDRWPESQLPILVVVSPGILGKPERMGNGSYRAPYSIQLAPIVSADWEGSTRRLAQAHALACRALVLQHKSMGGLADEVEWLGERYDAIAFPETRTLQAGMVAFTVWVPDSVTDLGGPVAPLPTPEVDPGAWPEATLVDVTVDAKSITEDVQS